MKLVTHSFFNRSAVIVARELIGYFLVRKNGNRVRRYLITETEAYEGFTDRASHASKGKTKRNEIMFRSAGHIYVYFTYGIHWMLNIVTGPIDYPAAVLIRGAISVSDNTELKGPAILTKKLKIDGTMNGKKLSKKVRLWIEKPITTINPRKISRTARIGVLYAGPVWANKKWRFVLK